MEARLDAKLPDDFIGFLSITDSFYNDDSENSNSLFTNSANMAFEDGAMSETLELFPWEHLPISLLNYFNWPELEGGIQTGSGTDGAYQLLIAPKVIKQAAEAFLVKYESADEGTKRVLERAAQDSYGGLEELRKLDWIVIVCYRWGTTTYVYSSFRMFLDHLVLEVGERLEKAKKEAKTLNPIQGSTSQKESFWLSAVP